MPSFNIRKGNSKYIVQLEHSQYKEHNMQPCKQMFHSNSWKTSTSMDEFESVLVEEIFLGFAYGLESLQHTCTFI